MMPPTPNLDRLLELAGVLGADAAWLLRGCDEVQLEYFMPGEGDDTDPHELVVQPAQEEGHFLWSAVLIAHFPAADIGVSKLTEMKLPPGRDREIQAAALVSAAIDALSRLGPGPTIRVLSWAFDRYGIRTAPFEARDRRPSTEPPPKSATTETTRLDPAAERGAQLREQRLALGITQQELAGHIGLEILPRARISLIERGKLDVDDATWSQIEIALVDLRKERGA